MALTYINSEDRLVQQTFADHLRDRLGWDSVYAYNAETFGPHGTLGRASEREVVLVRELKIQGVRVPHYNRGANIVVISDEAHRTQAGKFARNMRLALPDAAFIGFTGTPLLKYDQLTRRISFFRSLIK